MANSRAINIRADIFFRSRKRARAHASGTYHDRAVDEDDFEIVQTREARLNSRKRPLETPRSPQRGRTSWQVGTAWQPVDDLELGLDATGDLCDEEYGKEPTDAPRPSAPTKKKKEKSRVSVSISFSLRKPSPEDISTETTPCCLEGEAPQGLP